jgi:hypothetical protein
MVLLVAFLIVVYIPRYYASWAQRTRAKDPLPKSQNVRFIDLVPGTKASVAKAGEFPYVRRHPILRPRHRQ